MLRALAAGGRISFTASSTRTSAAKARAFLDELGNPFARIATDPDGRTGIDWGLTGVPETFVVDAKGIVRAHVSGPLTPEIVEDTILPALRAGRVLASARTWRLLRRARTGLGIGGFRRGHDGHEHLGELGPVRRAQCGDEHAFHAFGGSAARAQCLLPAGGHVHRVGARVVPRCARGATASCDHAPHHLGERRAVDVGDRHQIGLADAVALLHGDEHRELRLGQFARRRLAARTDRWRIGSRRGADAMAVCERSKPSVLRGPFDAMPHPRALISVFWIDQYAVRGAHHSRIASPVQTDWKKFVCTKLIRARTVLFRSRTGPQDSPMPCDFAPRRRRLRSDGATGTGVCAKANKSVSGKTPHTLNATH